MHSRGYHRAQLSSPCQGVLPLQATHMSERGPCLGCRVGCRHTSTHLPISLELLWLLPQLWGPAARCHHDRCPAGIQALTQSPSRPPAQQPASMHWAGS